METVELETLQNINLVQSKYTELATIVSSIKKKISDLVEEKSELRSKEFLENNGCKKCGGCGWYVTWDTMDSLSGCYAEYSDCLCKEEDRIKSGLQPYYGKYCRNHGVRIPGNSEYRIGSVKDILNHYYPGTFDDLDEKLYAAQQNLSEFCLENRINIHGDQSFLKGDRVLIFKGRKMKGKVGTIAAYHDSNHGRSWIVKNSSHLLREDPGIWINESNLTRFL